MSNIDRTTSEIQTVLIHDEAKAVHVYVHVHVNVNVDVYVDVHVDVDGFCLIKNQNKFTVPTAAG